MTSKPTSKHLSSQQKQQHPDSQCACWEGSWGHEVYHSTWHADIIPNIPTGEAIQLPWQTSVKWLGGLCGWGEEIQELTRSFHLPWDFPIRGRLDLEVYTILEDNPTPECGTRCFKIKPMTPVLSPCCRCLECLDGGTHDSPSQQAVSLVTNSKKRSVKTATCPTGNRLKTLLVSTYHKPLDNWGYFWVITSSSYFWTDDLTLRTLCCIIFPLIHAVL